MQQQKRAVAAQDGEHTTRREEKFFKPTSSRLDFAWNRDYAMKKRINHTSIP